MRTRFPGILAALALMAGTAIGCLDPRPTWDDTAITGGAAAMVVGTVGGGIGAVVGGMVAAEPGH